MIQVGAYLRLKSCLNLVFMTRVQVRVRVISLEIRFQDMHVEQFVIRNFAMARQPEIGGRLRRRRQMQCVLHVMNHKPSFAIMIYHLSSPSLQIH